MSLPALPEIFIPVRDKRRLKQLVARASNERSSIAPFLRSELHRANVSPGKSLPQHTVVMNSWVTFRIDWGPQQRARMLFPQDCATANDQISILSPLGVALLGLRRGDVMPFFAENRTFRVVTVLNVEVPPANDGRDQTISDPE
ncbi:MAG: GreA/GreB family elongation factor [Rhizomicrobium sp.]